MERETKYYNLYINILKDLKREQKCLNRKYDLEEKCRDELNNNLALENQINENILIWFKYLILCTGHYDTVPKFILEFINVENYKLIVTILRTCFVENERETVQVNGLEKIYRFVIDVFIKIKTDINCRDVNVQINLAKIYKKLGESEKSIKIYRGLVYSNNSINAAFLLIEVYKEKIDSLLEIIPSEAAKAQKELLDLFRYTKRKTICIKDDGDEFYKKKSRNYYTKLVCEEANYLRRNKEYQACYQLLNSEIEYIGPSSSLWNELGKLYEEQNDNIFFNIKKARECYENAYTLLLDIRKDDIAKDVLLAIARTSLEMNDYDKAECMCCRLLKIEKGNLQAKSLLYKTRKTRKEA